MVSGNAPDQKPKLTLIDQFKGQLYDAIRERDETRMDMAVGNLFKSLPERSFKNIISEALAYTITIGRSKAGDFLLENGAEYKGQNLSRDPGIEKERRAFIRNQVDALELLQENPDVNKAAIATIQESVREAEETIESLYTGRYSHEPFVSGVSRVIDSRTSEIEQGTFQALEKRKPEEIRANPLSIYHMTAKILRRYLVEDRRNGLLTINSATEAQGDSDQPSKAEEPHLGFSANFEEGSQTVAAMSKLLRGPHVHSISYAIHYLNNTKIPDSENLGRKRPYIDDKAAAALYTALFEATRKHLGFSHAPLSLDPKTLAQQVTEAINLDTKTECIRSDRRGDHVSKNSILARRIAQTIKEFGTMELVEAVAQMKEKSHLTEGFDKIFDVAFETATEILKQNRMKTSGLEKIGTTDPNANSLIRTLVRQYIADDGNRISVDGDEVNFRKDSILVAALRVAIGNRDQEITATDITSLNANIPKLEGITDEQREQLRLTEQEIKILSRALIKAQHSTNISAAGEITA